MDEGQLFVVILATLVLAAFTVELVGSLRDYSAKRPPGDRRRKRASRFRDIIKSFILWIGVLSIWAGRIVATFVTDPDSRRIYGLFSAAGITGALLLGGAFLAYTRIFDADDIVS